LDLPSRTPRRNRARESVRELRRVREARPLAEPARRQSAPGWWPATQRLSGTQPHPPARPPAFGPHAAASQVPAWHQQKPAKPGPLRPPGSLPIWAVRVGAATWGWPEVLSQALCWALRPAVSLGLAREVCQGSNVRWESRARDPGGWPATRGGRLWRYCSQGARAGRQHSPVRLRQGPLLVAACFPPWRPA
jgi:hypothetical protein